MVLRLIGALVFIYVASFVLFVVTLPRTAPDAPHADGIVALTGGDARLDAAVALLEKGAAKRLLVTGVHETTTKVELKKLGHGGARFDCCADLGYDAEDTHGNAVEAALWARKHHYKSLIVVTASYHMPRSLTEFGAEMPHTALIAYPVEPAGVNMSAWWPTPGTLHLLHSEFLKYLASVITTHLSTPESRHTFDNGPSLHDSRPTS